jgi:hypothetical protein
MIHYKLTLQNAQTLAQEMSDIAHSASNNNALITNIVNFDDHVIVEVTALDFNLFEKKLEENVQHAYDALGASLKEGLEPISVTPNVLEYMKRMIPVIKEEIAMLDDACLNASTEELMEEFNRSYTAKTKLLNLVFKLSSNNIYVNMG